MSARWNVNSSTALPNRDSDRYSQTGSAPAIRWKGAAGSRFMPNRRVTQGAPSIHRLKLLDCGRVTDDPETIRGGDRESSGIYRNRLPSGGRGKSSRSRKRRTRPASGLSSEFVTTDAARWVGVFPPDRLSIGCIDLLPGRVQRDDFMEKSDKVEAGMARGGPAVDPSGGGVQRGIQRKSAMPVIQSRDARRSAAVVRVLPQSTCPIKPSTMATARTLLHHPLDSSLRSE